MLKYTLNSLLVLAIFIPATNSFAGAPNCHQILIESQLIPKKSIKANLLQLRGTFTINNKEYKGEFSEILKNADVKSYLEQNRNQVYKILGKHKMPDSLGGGYLRLVTLNLDNGNRAYNHQELAALLKVNPQLANKIGFFAVEGFENMVWAPDMTQTNHRLKQIAQANGIARATWSYGMAEGVVSFKPYIELLANGKFPFSTDNDVNLSVHDVMHAVSFSALNSSVHAQKVMEVAQTRNAAVLRLYERLMKEFPQLDQLFQREAKMISSDPMERTMMLTIQLTGNYGYFSPSVSRDAGRPGSPQNKQVTTERVKNLLRLFTQGAVNFKQVYENMKSSAPAEKQAALKKLFQDEIKHIKYAREEDMQKASEEIVEAFFAKSIFSDDAEVKTTQQAAGTDVSPSSGAFNNYKYSTAEENIN